MQLSCANVHRVNARSRRASQQVPRRYLSNHVLRDKQPDTNLTQREPLATSFKCVFCNNETSVTVQLDKKNHIGTLNCRQCGQSFQSKSGMKRECTQPHSGSSRR